MAVGGVRRGILVAVAGWLAVLALVVVYLESRRAAAPHEAAPPDALASAGAPRAKPAGADAEPHRKPYARRPLPGPDEEPVPYIEGLVWGELDLREAQAIMPENLYWELGAPTKDPDVLEAREEEKKRRNEEYGRVLSGDAGEEEVRGYYDYRTQLSTDYLEFAQYMRNRYGEKLDEKFRGLLELSIKLHTARLAQIPHDLETALEHSRTRAKIREDWQRQQEEFDAALR